MNKSIFMRRTWATVDLKQLSTNVQLFANSRKNNTSIIAVVKADAYGHGDVMIAKTLQKDGVKMFAVSNIDEAVKLRKAGIHGEILVLGYTPVECANLLYKYKITQTLISYDYAEALSQHSKHILPCHIAIETGMKRIGFDSTDVDDCVSKIRQCTKKFKVTGLFTHLCVADSRRENDINFTNIQIDKLEKIMNKLSDLDLMVHCLNSAGGLYYTDQRRSISNVVRLGIIMYGLKPSQDVILPFGIKPVLSWKTVVSTVRKIEPGETVGYGRSFAATQEMKIATLPVGYADGYNRLLSNKGYVLINGKKAPIVGRICMDQMMVDVSHIDCVSVGDEVFLIGKSGNEIITAENLAELVNTIGYEIVCNISKRVPRVYLN